ncbi:iron-sulfur cluster assembly accessory protein [Haematospirillum jordaniae]|uniref:Fe-S cluster assembly scaffold SufA n=1 Tax=Haematospirillum jordaniae TaxID=1549855 RepID=A0A143DEV3_9PROT|nr:MULTISPECIES: iron-sulfur cluster assembly accessory protein [Haematospirillum]AMW35060.1 Fe-S cluster assembly scaffold SufA [Haematospirillum jordaniae]NKD44193.1 iron-sulfur cluster assembly accessory protein [Haematospirillum jordaniae]NKD56571.1 iron-sulfur cluster assembly accessory protein [Haematospirillum jordaniae]NKD58629.1 iron-sulfur cluster assembly accessory protein [Haematospirillum jordaniae]NKD66202.1 iron-sulfur cluster assembly accessory protein [Haematospirillum jordani
MFAEPGKKVLQLTDAAAQRVRDLVARSEKPMIGLRVGIKTRGCSGMSYVVEYAEEKKPFEEVIEDKGVTILVDPMALMFVLGATMDYRVDKFSSGFVFDNPNETGRCGCGESFSVDKSVATD